MATLLMRISAPMQSWGTQSHFSHRDTGREPSKSGIVGLMCAALGRPRHESITDLSQLKMGVRIDQSGMVRRDYHTAGEGGYYKVSGSVGKNTILSERYYLADAKFLIGLESNDYAFLNTLQKALQSPQWFLFLGRKAFMPSERVWLADGLQEASLLDCFKSYPWLGSQPNISPKLQVIIEDPKGTVVRNDQPISFKPRRFIPRRLRIDRVDNPGYFEGS